MLFLLPLNLQAQQSAWSKLWLTPDQQGHRLFAKGEFLSAAKTFQDPMWQGTALFRAGEFEKSALAFARRDTPEGHYNQGNAWLMNGKYEAAIKCYNRALEKRPDWKQAIENRDLAKARAKMVEITGGDMGDQQIGADKIVFDKMKPGGQDTQVSGEKAADSSSMQALWLRRVQTKPADFLKAKFQYQQAIQQEGDE
ncbi:MAG: tetratricopeptide repeat protein [Akkermansiaceae bacterium]|nr:tetratricopeptide repeat protein [Akkermansiaceae bacterium]